MKWKKEKETPMELPEIPTFNDQIRGKIDKRREVYRELTKAQKNQRSAKSK